MGSIDLRSGWPRPWFEGHGRCLLDSHFCRVGPLAMTASKRAILAQRAAAAARGMAPGFWLAFAVMTFFGAAAFGLVLNGSSPIYLNDPLTPRAAMEWPRIHTLQESKFSKCVRSI